MIYQVFASAILALAVGCGAGALYFLGLWWTVRHLPVVRRPELLMFASLAVRTAVVIYSLYLVMDSSWINLLSGLGGFLLARTALTHWLQPVRARTMGVE